MASNQLAAWRGIFVGCAVAVSGCSGDPVSPKPVGVQPTNGARHNWVGSGHERSFKGKDGTVFRLDAAGMLSVNGGEPVAVPVGMKARLERVLDSYSKSAKIRNRLERDANYQRYRAELQSRGASQRRFRVNRSVPPSGFVVSPNVSRGSGLASIVQGTTKPSKASITSAAGPIALPNEESGGHVCLDISEAIYNTQQQLNELNYEIANLLWAIFRAQNFGDPASPDYLTGLGILFGQLTLLEITQAAYELDLNVLAWMWNLNDCWDWQNTPPPSGGGEADGDSGDNGGGNSGGCHQEWVIIEESYDDGETWEVVWEGYATVC